MPQMDQEQDHLRPPTRIQFPLDAASYKILAEIGAGVSAVVYKALCVPLNSAPVAIKSIDLDKSYVTGDVIDNVRREAKIMSLLSHPNVLNAHCSFTVGRRLWVVMPFMSLLSHPNVLNAHCSFTVGRRLWVVMPFMSAGSVQSVMASAFPTGLPEPCIAFVLREILHALSYLHAQGHLHRDVKAGNVLVDGDGSVKLADFGVSASIHDGSPITDLAGTPYWMAPEVIHSHNGYGVKADIWSFGITALELAHGRPPLSHLPLSESLVLTITKRFRFSDYENSGGYATAKESSKRFSKAFKEMVGLCLNQEPSKRPTAEKLLKHSFFKGCKGSEILVKTVLQGLPSVEERFNFLKTSASSEHETAKKINGDEDEEDESELKEKKRRISGWNFNEDIFELDPVFPTLSGELSDRPGQEQYVSGITESEPSSPSQSLESPGPTERSSGDANLPSSPGGIARERLLRDILNLRRNIDMERKTVAEILRLIGASETETREEQLERAAEMARLELEIERRRNSELELENEFLKMQLQREE